MLNETDPIHRSSERKGEEEEVGATGKAESSTLMCSSTSHLIGVTQQREAGLQQGLPQC